MIMSARTYFVEINSGRLHRWPLWAKIELIFSFVAGHRSSWTCTKPIRHHGHTKMKSKEDAVFVYTHTSLNMSGWAFPGFKISVINRGHHSGRFRLTGSLVDISPSGLKWRFRVDEISTAVPAGSTSKIETDSLFLDSTSRDVPYEKFTYVIAGN